MEEQTDKYTSTYRDIYRDKTNCNYNTIILHD